MELVVIMAVVAVVAWTVTAPLRKREVDRRDLREATERADLEAQKEAKYREIREAEMDWRTGKLGEADYRELDRRLRREAVELLKALDRLSTPEAEKPRE
jgi:flagellar biosynthesis/type III secretory pathway M-ring protein FliF/YscJ